MSAHEQAMQEEAEKNWNAAMHDLEQALRDELVQLDALTPGQLRRALAKFEDAVGWSHTKSA